MQPILIIYDETECNLGQNTFVDSSAENGFSVIFEDNGETGYFYAIDRNNNLAVLDALHIYNVADIIDNDKPSTVKVLWTEDLMKVFLSINDFYHAVFDFKNQAGYCRNGFPQNNSGWTKINDRILTDELIEKVSRLK